MAAKIRKGDMVEVIAGRDKGARGTVLEVLRRENRLIVEGVNMIKRHVKAGARQSMPQGGILERAGKIHVSNVRLWSEKLERGVRVGFETLDDGSKVRVVRGGEGSGTRLD